MWQSSFPTAAEPLGAFSLLLLRASSLHIVNLLLPCSQAQAVPEESCERTLKSWLSLLPCKYGKCVFPSLILVQKTGSHSAVKLTNSRPICSYEPHKISGRLHCSSSGVGQVSGNKILKAFSFRVFPYEEA